MCPSLFGWKENIYPNSTLCIVVVVGKCYGRQQVHQGGEVKMFDRCTIKVVEMQIRCGVDCGGKVDASWCW